MEALGRETGVFGKGEGCRGAGEDRIAKGSVGGCEGRDLWSWAERCDCSNDGAGVVDREDVCEPASAENGS